ncbi:MAG: hypothetical protein C0616_07840 [Desulfuromonas sp.]|nr:MAG: hypothetical protein C0616_07840 [Desulfuromonas sp.]
MESTLKKILGIVGSLRESGNSEIMVKQISREIAEPHALKLLRLPEFNLNYCNGCYRCLMTRRGCVIQDDLATILNAIAGADALILAVPTYFLSAHSCLKKFIDRGISFYAHAEGLWGKPAVGVGIAGIEGKEGSTLLDMERFFTSLLAKNMRCEIVYGALPGEVLLKEEGKAIAREMARALFSATKSDGHQGLCCTCCGGETFRFENGNRVRCMLCSEAGRIEANADGQMTLTMEAGEHPIFASEAEALNHREWLLGMVGRFKLQKDDLANVRSEFADGTPWIRPAATMDPG